MLGHAQANGLSWSSIWVASDTDAWAVGEAGLAYHYLNGSWSLVRTAMTSSLRTIYGFGANDVWAAGASGAGVHWDGTQWSPMADVSTDGASISALWGITGPLWAAGASPSYYYSYPNAEADSFTGTAWRYNFSDCNSSLTSIWGSAANDVWFTCYGQDFWHYDGVKFTAASAGVTPVNGLWGTASNSIFAIGSNNGSSTGFNPRASCWPGLGVRVRAATRECVLGGSP